MKSFSSRLLYGSLAVVGAAMLWQGHARHQTQLAILGTLFLLLALFFAHWPLSWKKDWVS